MPFHNNLLLLFISYYLLISFHLTRSHLSPILCPFPQPELSLGSNPPAKSASQNTESTSQPEDVNKFTATIYSNKIDPKVKEICDSTDYPTLCLATVLPLLKGQANIDVPLVCDVTINSTSKLAKLALNIVKKISENPRTSPDLVAILKDCKGSYDDVVYNFQRAQESFAVRDIGTMNSMLSAVLTNVGDCEDVFEGRHSPLSNYADKLTNMTSNCLAIISLMH